MNRLHLLICLCLWDLDCMLWHFFPNRFWFNLAYSVMSSGNSYLLSAFSHCHSLGDDSNFFLNNRIFFFVNSFGKRTWWFAWRRGYFLFFSPFSFKFFFFSTYGVSAASGLGWTVSTEFTIILLLDSPCKSIVLYVIPSSAFASVFCIGTSTTEIVNGPSLIIPFLVMFLGILVISSGNSYLLSAFSHCHGIGDDSNFFLNNRIVFFIISFRRRTWWFAWRRGSFLVFSPFFFKFFFFSTYRVSTASGSGWTVSILSLLLFCC